MIRRDRPGEADVLVLWRPAASRWAEARRRGMADLSWREYLLRLSATAEEARIAGLPVAWCGATPGQVAECLRRHRLLNTPDGRAAAFVLLMMGDDEEEQ